MSNSIWFTWVSELVARRRFFVFLAVVGTSSTCCPAWVMATDPGCEIDLLPATVSWTPSSNFAMILADEVADKNEAEIEAGKKELKDSAEVIDEDERRRQRLRDLLGEDADMSPEKGTDSERTKPGRGDKTSNAMEIDEGGKSMFAKPFIPTRLPEVEAGRFVLPSIRAVSIDQKPIGNGRVPETISAGDELDLAPFPEDGSSRMSLTGGGAWPQFWRPWAAPNTFSNPLYFEDRMLERHGQERWGYFQPLASGVRFYATLPMLPYLATVQEPCDIVYSKGYYRAGSPVPIFLQRPPLEQRAVIVEAAVVSGTIIALP